MSRRIGAAAEQKAAAYLKSRGFEILNTNYTIRGAEIDIIAREGDTYAFIEVKARGVHAQIAPREAVTASKQRRICKAALCWLQENGAMEANVRFDIIEVMEERITLLRAAFLFG